MKYINSLCYMSADKNKHPVCILYAGASYSDTCLKQINLFSFADGIIVTVEAVILNILIKREDSVGHEQ